MIRRVILRRVEMPLKFRFRTSAAETSTKKFLLIELDAGEVSGWGECVAEETPSYSPETLQTAGHVLKDFLIPRLLENRESAPEDFARISAGVRGHRMAKACLETALWDLRGRREGVPLSRLIGGTRASVPVGVSLGLQPTLGGLMDLVRTHVAAGYKRIKVKIEPGRDVGVVRAVREAFPSIVLTADANAAYTLADARTLAALDEFKLDYLEQPLHHEDLLDHAELARRIQTPICLDESIRSAADASAAIRLRAAAVLNIKVGRVGGLAEARRIHHTAELAAVPVWCGGMLEAGVGRAVNVHLASLPNFVKPGDTSSASRYFDEDIVQPMLEAADGEMTVPEGPGIGVAVVRKSLDRFTTAVEVFGR
jgi:O-succinylbenzoate synthase